METVNEINEQEITLYNDYLASIIQISLRKIRTSLQVCREGYKTPLYLYNNNRRTTPHAHDTVSTSSDYESLKDQCWVLSYSCGPWMIYPCTLRHRARPHLTTANSVNHLPHYNGVLGQKPNRPCPQGKRCQMTELDYLHTMVTIMFIISIPGMGIGW